MIVYNNILGNTEITFFSVTSHASTYWFIYGQTCDSGLYMFVWIYCQDWHHLVLNVNVTDIILFWTWNIWCVSTYVSTCTSASHVICDIQTEATANYSALPDWQRLCQSDKRHLGERTALWNHISFWKRTFWNPGLCLDFMISFSMLNSES